MKLVEYKRRRTGRYSFPGLLGRGLIEANLQTASEIVLLEPSPVYWAGASLKQSKL